MANDQQMVSAVLPNGSEISILVQKGANASADIAAVDRLDLDGVSRALSGLAQLTRDAVAHVAPDSATVEFGLDVKLESGKLTGLLVSGSGEARLKVTLTWKSSENQS
jgi:Trypsin-co-occurring domain 1